MSEPELIKLGAQKTAENLLLLYHRDWNRTAQFINRAIPEQWVNKPSRNQRSIFRPDAKNRQPFLILTEERSQHFQAVKQGRE